MVIKYCRRLGAGSFGVVLLVTDASDPIYVHKVNNLQLCAFFKKITHIQYVGTSEAVTKEASVYNLVHKNGRHPHFIYCAAINEQEKYLKLECANCGTLDALMLQRFKLENHEKYKRVSS